MELLDESLGISTELGLRPLMERIAALQTQAESFPAKKPAYPDGFTQREVEVLRLVSGGKTDREIGEELFISILNKTNTANRTEAASYATGHQLTTSPAPTDSAG